MKWSLCSKGKKQSPIDITPEQLLFDPSLGNIEITGTFISGNLTNTGRGIVFKVSQEKLEEGGRAPSKDEEKEEITLSGGPLSYKYTLSHLDFHFGRELTRGSEHSIDGQKFPGEVQLYFFNAQLYPSFEEAVLRSHGVAAIAILIQLNPDAKHTNPQLKSITHAMKNITTKGKRKGIVLSPDPGGCR